MFRASTGSVANRESPRCMSANAGSAFGYWSAAGAVAGVGRRARPGDGVPIGAVIGDIVDGAVRGCIGNVNAFGDIGFGAGETSVATSENADGMLRGGSRSSGLAMSASDARLAGKLASGGGASGSLAPLPAGSPLPVGTSSSGKYVPV